MRLPRVRFTVRRLMVVVVMEAAMSLCYVVLLRYRPGLRRAPADQEILADGAEEAYQNAELTREVAPPPFQLEAARSRLRLLVLRPRATGPRGPPARGRIRKGMALRDGG